MSKNLFKNKSLDTLPLDFHVENHPLDGEQRKSIYDPARFNLVVAGAGSGKTTTILGKILYLLQSGFASPPEILVLSFTHDSATELRERFCANIIKHLRNRFCSENLRHPILRLRPSIV